MARSEQHDWVGQGSAADQALKGEVINKSILETGFEETQELLAKAQEVLLPVAKYMECGTTVQRVCDHLAQIITWQKEMMDPNAQHFLQPTCHHSEMDEQIQGR